MGRKLTILALTGLLLITSACSNLAGASEEDSQPEYKAIKIEGTPFEFRLSGRPITEYCLEQAENATGAFICPSNIERNTYHRGNTYSWETVVKNTTSDNRTLRLVATESFDTRPNYVSADKRLLELVTLQDLVTGERKRVSIESELLPQEIRVFKISLEIPKNMEMPSKWEFRIRLKRRVGGNVFSEVEQRVQVDIKD